MYKIITKNSINSVNYRIILIIEYLNSYIIELVYISSIIKINIINNFILVIKIFEFIFEQSGDFKLDNTNKI